MLGLGKLSSVVEGEADIWVGGPTSDLRALDVACAANDDLENADCGIERDTGKDLLEVEGEDMWVVHHRSQGAVDHVSDECGETRNLTRC